MKIDLETVLIKANQYYADARAIPFEGYFAPAMPSDQIRALAKALVEEINEALGLLTTRPDGRVFMASPGIM